MAIERTTLFLIIQEITTTVEASLFTKVKVVVQSDVKLISSMAETLLVEFNQHRHEEYLSSSSSGLKSTRCYRRVIANKDEISRNS